MNGHRGIRLVARKSLVPALIALIGVGVAGACVPPPSTVLEVGMCYHVTSGTVGALSDFVYNGPVQWQNTTNYNSTNGMCNGGTTTLGGQSWTVIQANSKTEANAVCTSLNAGGFGYKMDGTDPEYFKTWSTPPNTYVCGSHGDV